MRKGQVKKRISSISAGLILALLFSVVPQQPAYADKFPEIYRIEFNDVEKLVTARNMTARMAREAYDKAKLNIGAQLDAADERIARQPYIEMIIKNSGLSEEMQGLMGLLFAPGGAAVGGSDLETYRLDTEKAIFSIVQAAQNVYIQYFETKDTLAKMEAQKPVAERNLGITNLRQQLGMATANDVAAARQQYNDLVNGISMVKRAHETIKQQLNLLLSQDISVNLQIGDLPLIPEYMITTINADSDYARAEGLSFTVKKMRLENDEKQDNAKRTFKSEFYKTYDDLKASWDTLKSEQAKYALEQEKYNISELKYKLGMISAIQRETAYSSLVAQGAAFGAAQRNLLKAYLTYGWACRGLTASMGV